MLWIGRSANGAVFAVSAVFVLSPMLSAAPRPTLPTPGEASHYTRYTQNEDVARFLSRLAHRSPKLAVRVVGRSHAVNTHPAQDLYLAILSATGAAAPEQLDRTRPTLFLFASQHGNEQSAKEAALVLVRDLAVGPLEPLLERVNVLVMPQVNPHGNHADRRRNERGLDLNRDHVKLEAPQTRALHRVFRRWMPEVSVDMHEKGDDYYRAAFGCVSNINIDRRLQDSCRDVLLADVAKALDAQGIPFHEYLVTQRMGIESAAGAALPAGAGEERPFMKRYSTTDLNDGRNSLGIYETLSLIFEGASRHDLETLGARTSWQVAALHALVESVARHNDEMVSLVRSLRAALVQRAALYSKDDRVHLRMKYTRSAKEPTFTLRRLATADEPILGVLGRDMQAGEPVSRGDLEPYRYDSQTKVLEKIVENWFPDVRSTRSVARPLGYVLPADRLDVVELLLEHGIAVEIFVAAATLPVEVYRITRIVPAGFDYLAPEEIEVEPRIAEVRLEEGSFYVPTAQAAANLIPALLEPESQYGLIRYRKFDLVLQEGESFPFARQISPAELPTVPYKPWPR